MGDLPDMTSRDDKPVRSDGDQALAWRRWLDGEAGQYVRNWEERTCAHLVADVFGYHALQCGSVAIDCLRANRMPDRIWVAGAAEAGVIGTGSGQVPSPSAGAWPHCSGEDSPPSLIVVDRFEHLPFASQSVDLVILPHVLEFAEEPHLILREADRVLRPEGRLIVTGFNPVSLWGLRQSVGRWSGREWLPEPAQMVTIARLRDWLKLLGLSMDEVLHGCYRPALRTGRWLERFTFMESAGDRWWPILGAVYAVSAIKRIAGLRLQGPVLRKRFSRPLAAPVATHRDTYSRVKVARDSPDHAGRGES
jgi:SAM-dependent methyltransferase